MNLDDLIFPSSVGSPSGIPPSPPSDHGPTSTNAVAAAIPIKQHNRQSHAQLHQVYPPSSVPIPPPHRLKNGEFNYVRRHVRKTSIDDRRVRFKSLSSLGVHISLFSFSFIRFSFSPARFPKLRDILTPTRPGKGPRISPHKFLLLPAL